MVERLANRLADRIIAENNVSENMREWYIYSFLHIFETSISVLYFTQRQDRRFSL